MLRAQEELRKAQEEVIVSRLSQILEQGDMDFRLVLQQMLSVPEFRETLTGSTAVLTRFLLTRPDIFWYRQDAQHTTRVGLACNHEA